jgi:sec-independent protein translocase protein TatA
MFNIGAPELIVILIVALIVVGPKRLPELGRQVGRGLNEFRKLQDEVRDMVRFDLGSEPAEPQVTPAPMPYEDLDADHDASENPNPEDDWPSATEPLPNVLAASSQPDEVGATETIGDPVTSEADRAVGPDAEPS